MGGCGDILFPLVQPVPPPSTPQLLIAMGTGVVVQGWMYWQCERCYCAELLLIGWNKVARLTICFNNQSINLLDFKYHIYQES